MKKAWIENNQVRDVCPGDPSEYYHPDIAVLFDTEVPDDIRSGATWDGAEWTNPPLPEITAPSESDVQAHLPDPAVPVPLIATKYKFRLALLNIGLLDDIESFIAASDDQAVKIAWQYADEYRTDDPLVLGMGAALGKTEAEIRAVFELANTL